MEEEEVRCTPAMAEEEEVCPTLPCEPAPAARPPVRAPEAAVVELPHAHVLVTKAPARSRGGGGGASARTRGGSDIIVVSVVAAANRDTPRGRERWQRKARDRSVSARRKGTVRRRWCFISVGAGVDGNTGFDCVAFWRC